MNEDQFSAMLAIIVPLVIEKITQNSNVDDDKAISRFYQSKLYQELSDEIYDRFVGIVADSRDMSDADVRALADGRIYSAQQGVENGLVDGIMTQEEFDDHLRELLGDDISFYHQTYEQETTSLIWEFLNNAVNAIRANGDEVTASLQAIDEMTYDEPMLIYEP